MRKKLNLERVRVPDDTQYAAYHDPGNEMPSLLEESFPHIYLFKAATVPLRFHKIPETILDSHAGLGGVPKDMYAIPIYTKRKELPPMKINHLNRSNILFICLSDDCISLWIVVL